MKIDFWTLGLQTVNVLVLLWLLQRFLYKPVQQVLAQRQQRIAQQLAHASDAQAQVAAARAAIEQEHAALAAAREHSIADAQLAAQTERERLMKQTHEELVTQAEIAAAALAAERRAAGTTLTHEAAALSVTIAKQLLERLPRAALLQSFVDGAGSALAQRPDAGNIADCEIELVSADALNETERTLCRERLAAALGKPLRLRFGVDPQLIAGVELRLPHTVVRNHWAHDLAEILDALKVDGQSD
jgi:F-type H+-transporting ATPase subunit b